MYRLELTSSGLTKPRPHITTQRWAEKYGPVFRCAASCHALQLVPASASLQKWL